MCGGGLVVETYTQSKHKPRVPHYVCARRRSNGACANAIRLSLAEIHEAVLQTIEEHALTPEAIEQVIHHSERADVADQQQTLARERKSIDNRIARLIAAIETGGDAASLVAKLRELEARSAPLTPRRPPCDPSLGSRGR